MKPIVLILSLMLLPALAAGAQTDTTATPPPAVTGANWETYDARMTRDEFKELIQRHPREVGVILKLDPSLFRNEAWISSYPAIRDFVSKHPEVAQNAEFYLESVWVPGDVTPESAETRVARQMMEGVSIFAVIATFIAGFVWLIRTLLDHRRWRRVSEIQTSIYNKLLDRFTSHEDLLRYVQSAAGRDFIQSAMAPITTGAAAPVAAPVNRILWSLQAGLILFAMGLGVQIVSSRLHEDVATSVSTMGVLGICAGLGFAASAVVAWIVSRRLGILPVPPSDAETVSLNERTLGE